MRSVQRVTSHKSKVGRHALLMVMAINLVCVGIRGEADGASLQDAEENFAGDRE